MKIKKNNKNTEFTVEELEQIRLSVIANEKFIRGLEIPNIGDAKKANDLMIEADALRSLRTKICAIKLSKELGMPIDVGEKSSKLATMLCNEIIENLADLWNYLDDQQREVFIKTTRDSYWNRLFPSE